MYEPTDRRPKSASIGTVDEGRRTDRTFLISGVTSTMTPASSGRESTAVWGPSVSVSCSFPLWSMRCRTEVASVRRPSRVRRVASIISLCIIVFMANFLSSEADRACTLNHRLSGRSLAGPNDVVRQNSSANPVAKGGFHLRTRVQRAQDLNRGNRRASEFGRNVISNGGKTQDVDVERLPRGADLL